MKKLLETKKITLATAKAFVNRNRKNLFVKVESDFDGMTDCVQAVGDKFTPAQFNESKYCYLEGIAGVWIVGSSRDYFRIYEDAQYFGITVSNCCGSAILAISK